jgi:hypothetical protein
MPAAEESEKPGRGDNAHRNGIQMFGAKTSGHKKTKKCKKEREVEHSGDSPAQ